MDDGLIPKSCQLLLREVMCVLNCVLRGRGKPLFKRLLADKSLFVGGRLGSLPINHRIFLINQGLIADKSQINQPRNLEIRTSGQKQDTVKAQIVEQKIASASRTCSTY